MSDHQVQHALEQAVVTADQAGTKLVQVLDTDAANAVSELKRLRRVAQAADSLLKAEHSLGVAQEIARNKVGTGDQYITYAARRESEKWYCQCRDRLYDAINTLPTGVFGNPTATGNQK